MFRLCLLLTAIVLTAFPTTTFAQEKTKQPHVVIVVGTWHYSPERTMPVFEKELQRHGFRTTLVMADQDPEKLSGNVLPGIEALESADAAIFFSRFLKLPDSEFQYIENFLRRGKPVIGLRTANHSFKYPKGHPRYAWNDGFGRRALGTPYVVHQAGTTEISVVEKHRKHPIMTGVTKTNWVSKGTLYLTRLEAGCVPLVVGKGLGKPRLVEKDYGPIQINDSESDIVAWVWQNEWGGKVFGTSFGHPADFAEESFTRMLVNSVCWATDQPLPDVDQPIGTWSIEMIRRK